MKEDLNKWGDFPCSLIKWFNSIKMQILYKLNSTAIRMAAFFVVFWATWFSCVCFGKEGRRGDIEDTRLSLLRHYGPSSRTGRRTTGTGWQMAQRQSHVSRSLVPQASGGKAGLYTRREDWLSVLRKIKWNPHPLHKQILALNGPLFKAITKLVENMSV